MRRSVLRWLPLATLATMLMPVALAGPPADARAWLARIHEAAQRANYQGTMVTNAGGVMSSSRVAHFCSGENCYERLEALDGRQQRIYRLGNTVQTIWPQSRVAVVEQRQPSSRLPSAAQAVEPRALDEYDFKSQGEDRVAGRDAWVFLLEPRDKLRYAQRLWADKASGLMLRADVIGRDQSVVESAAFSEVEIGPHPQTETVPRALRQLDGYRVLRPTQQHTRLEAEGWTMTRPVPGFALVECLKRSLETPEQTDGSPALQAVFSDGLTHVSLFIEPEKPQHRIDSLNGQIGATASLRLLRADHWITLIGDVPSATLQVFADALERKR